MADFVVQLDDLVMIFQLKEREVPSTDPLSERTWFKKKVLTKATQQVRNTMRHLNASRPQIENDRGRRMSLPAVVDPESVVKVVVFRGGAELPMDCKRQRFHASKTAGFIHVLAAEDWAEILTTLVTPREVGEYLRMREVVCCKHSDRARMVSERALIGQFIAEAGEEPPSLNFEDALARLIDERSSFDMLRMLNLFPERLTTDAPPGTNQPSPLDDASNDYYPIILELAKLPRTDLAGFRTRFMLAWEHAGVPWDRVCTRMVSATGVGFVFVPVPRELETRALAGLMNCVHAHMYEQRVRRCIGICFVNEGEWRHTSWVLRDEEWRHDPSMERYLLEHPLPPVRNERVPRYRLSSE